MELGRGSLSLCAAQSAATQWSATLRSPPNFCTGKPTYSLLTSYLERTRNPIGRCSRECLISVVAYDSDIVTSVKCRARSNRSRLCRGIVLQSHCIRQGYMPKLTTSCDARLKRPDCSFALFCVSLFVRGSHPPLNLSWNFEVLASCWSSGSPWMPLTTLTKSLPTDCLLVARAESSNKFSAS